MKYYLHWNLCVLNLEIISKTFLIEDLIDFIFQPYISHNLYLRNCKIIIKFLKQLAITIRILYHQSIINY